MTVSIIRGVAVWDKGARARAMGYGRSIKLVSSLGLNKQDLQQNQILCDASLPACHNRDHWKVEQPFGAFDWVLRLTAS